MKRFLSLALVLCALVMAGCAAESEPETDKISTDTQPYTDTLLYQSVREDGEHPALIAHAGGAVYGYRLTNSLEAMNEAVASGFEYIELDMELTTDGGIVLIHDWDGAANRMLFSPGQRSLDEFLSADSFADLTLMDMDALISWLDENPSVTVITDIKAEDNAEVLENLKQQWPEATDRLIPQAYSYEEFEAIRTLGYDRVILTLYRMTTDSATLAEFAGESKPWAITIPESSLTQELITSVANTGTAVYAHTINSLDFYEQWSPLGLTGIYTDYFRPDYWPY